MNQARDRPGTTERDREPIATSDEPRLLRQMSRVAGCLYTSAGLLVGASVAVAGDLHRQPGVSMLIAVTGLVAGVAWLVVGERVAVPRWAHLPSTAAGSVLVGLLVVAAGPTFAGVYGIFLIYVVAFSFYYMTIRLAVGQVAVAAVVYAVALWQVQEPGWVAHLFVVLGASGAGAGIIAGLGHRSWELMEREQRTATRLRQVNDTRDLFVRMVAHDLRSPLATIQGAAETIAAYLPELDEEDIRMLVGRQISQGRRLLKLVGDLLDTERLRSRALELERRPVRLDELAARCVELADTSDHPVALDAEPVEAEVDPTLMERAVANLVANAIDHTAPGTPIDVRVATDDRGAVIEVEDRGPGIEEDAKQAVFELFIRGEHGGTGIGLALVRQVVETHGGRCSIRDRPGGGASFGIWLPTDPDGGSRPGRQQGAGTMSRSTRVGEEHRTGAP